MAKTWNLTRILDFCKDEEKMIEYFMERGVLKSTMDCPKCGEVMKRRNLFWRCYKTVKSKKRGKEKCNGKRSIRYGSWFSRSRLTMQKVMLVTYMMLYNYERQAIAHELDVNLETLTNWLCFLREVRPQNRKANVPRWARSAHNSAACETCDSNQNENCDAKSLRQICRSSAHT